MDSKRRIILFYTTLYLIVSLFANCVSASKYQSAIKKQDTLNKVLQQEVTRNYALSFEYAKIKTTFLEHLKQDSIRANNVTETTEINNYLLPFPNPPPQPSSRYVFQSKLFSACRTYSDVNDLLVKTLENCGYSNKFSYFLFDAGFVIATDIEQINADVTLKPSRERWFNERVSPIKNMFSLREYFKILFTAQPGYYRSFAFIISPEIYRFNANSYSKELYSKYLSQGSIGFPSEIGKAKLPNNTKVTVLIYEFKKPEQSSEAILQVDGYTGLEHLRKANIIKNLANGN
jgi:hypothetical protein